MAANSHDAQCVIYRGPDEDYQGREICFGADETALSIADVTDRENPVAIARGDYPNVGYAHQGCLPRTSATSSWVRRATRPRGVLTGHGR